MNRGTPARFTLVALVVSVVARADSGPAVQSLLSAERVERGATTYARACAACHGRDGKGDGPGAAGLSPAPRNFTQGQYRFRTTATGELPRPEDLERTIRRGLPGTAMPAFGDLLSADELGDLIRFLYSLLPENRVADALPEPVSPRSTQAETATIAEGRALYLLLECWTCHGLDGSGRGKASAALVDETGRPIPPPDFRYGPLKGGREPEAIVRTFVTGLNGTPMPAYDEALRFAREDVADLSAFAGRLAETDLRALADFVQTVPAKAELEPLGDEGRNALRERWLFSLARYVLSFDRRKGFRYWMFHERPESEPRP